MSVLHLVASSPLQSRALERCLVRVGQQDGILLLGNGVYAALPGLSADLGPPGARICPLFVLVEDLRIRGLADSQIDPDLVLVDYAGFVELAVRYPRCLTWT